jgi:hypothetical protein
VRAETGPNKGLELTAYSVRSFVAPASSRSSGLALGGSNGTPIHAWGHNRRHACIPAGTNYMEVAVTDEKSVLVIGLEPTLIDFSQPGYADTGMDATKVLAGLKSSEDELTRLGYRVQMCLTDFGETAEAVVQSQLKQKRFDCILIAAGIRTIPSNFMLFERLINVVHEHAPQAKLCFNLSGCDSPKLASSPLRVQSPLPFDTP